VIGDWAYADEARYLQQRIEWWREFSDPDDYDKADWARLEQLLEAYVHCNTLPEGKQMRPLFDRSAALGLGYAISIVVTRWEARDDYPLRPRRPRRPLTPEQIEELRQRNGRLIRDERGA
jgi:hypothetical protein